MPAIVRSRLALFSLMSVFIIPISQANLGGLTHVLTCKEQVEQPFTVVIPPDGGEPEMLSSLQITAEDTDSSLCGGLSVEPGVTLEGPGTMVMVVPIKNDSDFTWRGTVTLELDDTSIPVGIGEVPDHSTRTERVSFNLDEGTFELNGALSIGP